MSETHPPLDQTFFQKIRTLDMTIPSRLREYMTELLGSDPTPAMLAQLRMEDFFKDVYYDFTSSPNSQISRRAYTDLVNIYTRVLRQTTNWLCEDGRDGAPVGRLIAGAAEVADNVAIITFNHDLVIENEIFKRARLRPRWCVEEGYGAIGDTMTLLRSGVPGADFPTHSDACNHTHRPIQILKLHGSLNWVVRLQGRYPTARQLTGQTTNQQEVLLSRRREIIGRLRYTRPTKGKAGSGRTSWYTWPVIIPPIYAKQSLIHTVQAAWDEARAALTRCDRVVFFGYSLPSTDIEAEKLFQRSLAANASLDGVRIVNPSPESATRYASLLPKMRLSWYPTLDGLLGDGPFD
jgi:hypothetical protein